MMYFRLGVTFTALLVAGGCATTGQKHIESSLAQLETAKEVRSANELPVAGDLSFDKVAEFPLGSDKAEHVMLDRVWNRASGDRSFARLFRLPQWASPYSIQVSSYVVGPPNDPALFYPRFTLLDNDFRVTRQSVSTQFAYRAGISGRHGLSARVFLNEGNRDERYLLISGEPRVSVEVLKSAMQTSGTQPVTIPVKGGFLMWMIPTGSSEQPTPMQAAAGGTLQLKLEAYAPKIVGEK